MQHGFDDGLRVDALDQSQRDQYLSLGFVAELGDGDPLYLLGDWSREPRRDERSVSESALVREGVRALRTAIADCAAQADGRGEQVVFLSGGLDSRAVLGGLLELYRPEEVVAATFGSPGEQDFDFAADVARVAGVRHEVVQTSAAEWTTQGLADSVLARRVPLPHPCGQRYLSYRVHRQIGAGHTFWDGLLGDVVSGAHLPRVEERWTWEETVEHFVAEHVLPGSEQYTSPGFRPESVMPAEPFASDRVLSYPDQLDMAVRQGRYIVTRHLRGHTLRSPFLHRAWVDSVFGVPLRYRHEQRLCTAILRAAHPRLFRRPTTTFDGAGLPAAPWLRDPLVCQRRALRKVQRVTRLGDKPDSRANNAIRRAHVERPDIREMVGGNLQDLSARGVVPGSDEAAADRAMTDRRLRALLVDGLVGLELNLKAVDRLAARPRADTVARVDPEEQPVLESPPAG